MSVRKTAAAAAAMLVLGMTAMVLAQGNPEAAKLKNPAAATSESVAAGEKTYQKLSRSCHGKTGGGGMGPSLIDATWDHGGSDGEIFVAIQKGVGQRMEAWEDRVNEAETWNLVNYLRSIAAKAE